MEDEAIEEGDKRKEMSLNGGEMKGKSLGTAHYITTIRDFCSIQKIAEVVERV